MSSFLKLAPVSHPPPPSPCLVLSGRNTAFHTEKTQYYRGKRGIGSVSVSSGRYSVLASVPFSFHSGAGNNLSASNQS